MVSLSKPVGASRKPACRKQARPNRTPHLAVPPLLHGRAFDDFANDLARKGFVFRQNKDFLAPGLIGIAPAMDAVGIKRTLNPASEVVAVLAPHFAYSIFGIPRVEVRIAPFRF